MTNETVVTKERRMTDEEFELLYSYVENLESGSKNSIKEEHLEKVSEIIHYFWDNLKYDVSEFSTFLQSIEFIFDSNKTTLESLFQQLNIIITPKDRKKGRKAFYNRFVMKYHKKNVRNYVEKMFEFLMKDEIKNIKENSNVENIGEMINVMGFEPVWWAANTALKDEKLITVLKEEFKYEYVKMMIIFYFLYIKAEFDSIMDEPQKIKNDTPVNAEKIMKENQTLRNQVDKVKKNETNLKEEVYKLNQEKKQLQGEIHELYRLSLDEIDDLKEEKEKLIEAFQMEREMYIKTIAQLTEQINVVQEPHIDSFDVEEKLDLNGATICVIGGNKERHYAEIIESYNGKISFVSEDNFNKIKGAVQESVAVFFLKELVGHHHFRKTMDASRVSDKPFIYVNTKGTSSFERELKKFILEQKELVSA